MKNTNTPELVYHYTSLESFLKIWESQSLLFGCTRHLNDIFERNKIITTSGQSLPIIGTAKAEIERIQKFTKLFWEALYNYRQISLTCGYRKKLPKGYDIPMMWGHYARSRKTKRSKWQDGVCIELDFGKLNLANIECFSRRVIYTENIPPISLDDYNFITGSIDDYIIKHIKDLFFIKHNSWKPEREYRIITNDPNVQSLSIANAITGIYVPENESKTMRAVESVVGDDQMLFYLSNSCAQGRRRLSCYNVHKMREYEQGKRRYVKPTNP